MKSLVGVTSYTPAVSDDKYVLPRPYVDCLRRAGVEAVVLPLGDATVFLDRIDALVLAGGGDIDPTCYAGAVHATTYMVDRERDELELALVRGALAREMPVLAICRGMQILNVALGGSLHSHVPEHFGESVVHRLPPREPVPHPVTVTAGTRLAAIMGEGELEAVSWHHQAVDRLAEGLAVAARASDGLIEAVEVEPPTWVFGVQWHPELNALQSRRQARLFASLAEAAGQYRRRRT